MATKKIVIGNGEITRTVISKSATRLKGSMQEMVVYKQGKGSKRISVTKHEAVKK